MESEIIYRWGEIRIQRQRAKFARLDFCYVFKTQTPLDEIVIVLCCLLQSWHKRGYVFHVIRCRIGVIIRSAVQHISQIILNRRHFCSDNGVNVYGVWERYLLVSYIPAFKNVVLDIRIIGGIECALFFNLSCVNRTTKYAVGIIAHAQTIHIESVLRKGWPILRPNDDISSIHAVIELHVFQHKLVRAKIIWIQRPRAIAASIETFNKTINRHVVSYGCSNRFVINGK